jgi:S-formylglutathione hydrolase FrmB
MKKLLVFILLAICGIPLFAATVQNVKTFSASMNKGIDAFVITPVDYPAEQPYPVLYLLHGYGGDHSNWITKVPEIKEYVDRYNFIIVCPDGNKASWYLDSPVDSSSRYETYVARELTHWIDEHYKTISSAKGRAVAGLSMGGHGAFYLAFKNQDIFGAAGSMSGGLDLRPFPNNWDLANRLGHYSTHPKNWEKNSVINMVHLLTPGSLAITFDCGVNDFFYQVNLNLHEKLLERNIPHEFTARPGGHSWEYWENSIAYQSLFFHRFFSKQLSL